MAIKIKLCCACSTRHIQDQCPLQIPHYTIKDALTYDEWSEKYKSFDEEHINSQDFQDIEKDNNFKFAYISLPNGLCLNESSAIEGLSVYSNIDIKEFTQFGPLLGKVIKEVDISEDFNMKYLWQIYADKSHIYLNTEELNESNWIRFVRPAPTREEMNVVAICRNSQLFFITTKNILVGEELLYWQDDAFSTSKKKMEKTSTF